MCFRPLLSLTKLTSLEILWPTTTNFKLFFVEIGTACPSLKELKMKNAWSERNHQLQITLKDLVSLVLGQNAEMLTNSFWKKTRQPDMALHRLQFDENLITPICKSLQYLEINSGIKMAYTEQNISSTAAFLLRHIGRLEKLTILIEIGQFVPGTSLAVQLLHQELLEPKEIVNVSEVTSKEDGNGDFVRLNWTIDSPPPSIRIISNLIF